MFSPRTTVSRYALLENAPSPIAVADVRSTLVIEGAQLLYMKSIAINSPFITLMSYAYIKLLSYIQKSCVAGLH